MNRYRVSAADFGAVPSSTTLQTAALQRTIDDCYEHGGGVAEIPGGVYLTGGLRLRSGVTLRLLKNAVLLGSRDPMDYFGYLTDEVEPLNAWEISDAPYVHLFTIHGETAYRADKPEYRFKRLPGTRWNNALIRAIHARDIAIEGEEGACIDGNNCYDAQGEEDYRGPHGIHLFDCENVTLRGYTLQHSGNWAHHLLFSRNIVTQDITVLAGHDGFDAADCENIVIRNSRFYTGDDCIAGFGNVNVFITNCELNSACSAMRFAGTNVRVEKCHIFGPGKYLHRGSLTPEEKRAGVPSPEGSDHQDGHRSNMLSAFTYYADYSLPIPVLPGNIVLADCRIENADRLLHYNYSGNETWQKHRPLESLSFCGVTATGIKLPLDAYGDADTPFALEMKDVDMELDASFAAPAVVHACNFSRLTLENVTVRGKADALIATWSQGDISLKNVSCQPEPAQRVRAADYPFFSAPI
ncbi:MAG: glycosyl hydrolase family 28 protein [Eubacteriales bacterium]|nr:glycosyl hydrolase family 28 protein [Eubacteriales bacterium]